MDKTQIENIKKIWEKYGEATAADLADFIVDYVRPNVDESKGKFGEHLFIDGRGNYRFSNDYDSCKFDEAVILWDDNLGHLKKYECDLHAEIFQTSGSWPFPNVISRVINPKGLWLMANDCAQLCAEIDGITREKLTDWGFRIIEE